MMDYGDEYLAELAESARNAPGGPRHARPKAKRRTPRLVRRMAMWTLIFGVLYGIGAVYLAVCPPVFHMNMVPDAPPTPTAQISHAVSR